VDGFAGRCLSHSATSPCDLRLPGSRRLHDSGWSAHHAGVLRHRTQPPGV